jgi:hypothetical protein
LDFVSQIDTLIDREIIWQPYTDALVAAHAPQGLLSLCFQDCDFWMTKTPLVHDMYVDEYHVERVRGSLASTRLHLCPSHTLSTLSCTCKFIANINNFFGRVKKVSLLTKLLFLVAGG